MGTEDHITTQGAMDALGMETERAVNRGWGGKRGFPVLHCKAVPRVPYGLLEPHAAQALKNHGASLERLADAGGLYPVELLAILDDVPLAKMDPSRAERLLTAHVKSFLEKEGGRA